MMGSTYRSLCRGGTTYIRIVDSYLGWDPLDGESRQRGWQMPLTSCHC